MTPALSILVIEDDPAIQLLLQAFFRPTPHRVLCVSTGSEAFERLARQRFDVVLTDILMPGQSGFEVIACLRRDHPKLPVVVVSGSVIFSGADSRDKARAIGATDVLTKPFTRDQLFEVIDRVGRPEPPAAAGA